MSDAHLLIIMEQKKKFVRNKKEKIEIIYDTFIDLLKNEGYTNLSTNHIAEIAPISLGTIYRYFPEGKAAIAKGYFENIKDQIINEEFFLQAKKKNLPELFKSIITRHLQVYRENFKAFLAYEQAMLSNKDLFENYENSVHEFAEETVKRLRNEDSLFRSVPEKQFLKGFIFIYNLIEAIIRRHLVIFPIFQTDDELISFLIKTIVSTIKIKQEIE
ncbi:MAG: TetR/AcrR family transcriptional regulator [Promethearchaeota archaeon]|nr:MAG: TetR/AcrR family transcriptional regulator [Candidatus Lokiarchaeota archaeon]